MWKDLIVDSSYMRVLWFLLVNLMMLLFLLQLLIIVLPLLLMVFALSPSISLSPHHHHLGVVVVVVFVVLPVGHPVAFSLLLSASITRSHSLFLCSSLYTLRCKFVYFWCRTRWQTFTFKRLASKRNAAPPAASTSNFKDVTPAPASTSNVKAAPAASTFNDRDGLTTNSSDDGKEETFSPFPSKQTNVA